MVAEIVKAQVSHTAMSADDLAEGIKRVYKALKWVESQEGKATTKDAEGQTLSGPESIQRNKVICLECGKDFKVITARHLALHGVDPKGYKQRHGIPLRQSLSSRSLSAKRRRVAKKLGLGERLQERLKQKMQKTKKGKK
jgi:predicted transcriptional regulator